MENGRKIYGLFMMNTGVLQDTDILKNEFQKTDGLVRPETVFLATKDRLSSLQDILPYTHSQTVFRFSVLFAP